jgi:hypothetical protein
MPTGPDRNKEGLAVGGLVLEQLGDEIRLVLKVREILFPELISLTVKLIGEPLQEQHPEDEFLELGGVHLAAEDIRGLKEKGLELGEGDLVGAQ